MVRCRKGRWSFPFGGFLIHVPKTIERRWPIHDKKEHKAKTHMPELPGQD
jgi:hypothetical protein